MKRDENKTEEVVWNFNFWLKLPSKHDRVSFREDKTYLNIFYQVNKKG